MEAIQKLQPLTTAKECRSFVGMVNFLSIFCPELQNLQMPIYDLIRKGRQFIWGKEQQNAFEEIKHRLIKPPILHMPNSAGRIHLYSDTSKFAMGSVLYQIQNGKSKLILYASKRLPEAARNYSITELELCGLTINIVSFYHVLKVDFNAIVDHVALNHIIKSKAEPATARIKRLLELISSYSFSLYYIKSKDMILSNFLSRQNHDDSKPHEMIPISFNMHNLLHEKYYNICKLERYLVQTWSQTKSNGIKIARSSWCKSSDPNIKPEKQNIKPLKGNEISWERPQIGQGRAEWGEEGSHPLIKLLLKHQNCQRKLPRHQK